MAKLWTKKTEPPTTVLLRQLKTRSRPGRFVDENNKAENGKHFSGKTSHSCMFWPDERERGGSSFLKLSVMSWKFELWTYHPRQQVMLTCLIAESVLFSREVYAGETTLYSKICIMNFLVAILGPINTQTLQLLQNPPDLPCVLNSLPWRRRRNESEVRSCCIYWIIETFIFALPFRLWLHSHISTHPLTYYPQLPSPYK